jgi:hypothetical protein
MDQSLHAGVPQSVASRKMAHADQELRLEPLRPAPDPLLNRRFGSHELRYSVLQLMPGIAGKRQKGGSRKVQLATFLLPKICDWLATEMVIQGIFPWCFTPELYAARPDYIESLGERAPYPGG